VYTVVVVDEHGVQWAKKRNDTKTGGFMGEFEGVVDLIVCFRYTG
jgi:hypothetical protein